MIDDILWWLDGSPARYWSVAWFTFAVCLVLAWRPWAEEISASYLESVTFALALLICLFAFRWPILFVPSHLNVDESQMIAGVFTLRHDPVFWRSVDTQTAGPLNVYAAWIPTALSGANAYFGIRLLALLLGGATVLLLGWALRMVFPERIARISTLILLGSFAFAVDSDLVHYASELVPLFLLSLGTAGLTRCFTGGHRSWLWVAGLSLGAVPFAKLQGAPIAFWIGMCGIGFLAGTGGDGQRRPILIGLLIAGALTVPLLFVLTAWYFGTWEEMWISYFAGNSSYVAAGGLDGWRAGKEALARLLRLDVFGAIFCSTLVLTVLALSTKGRNGSIQRWMQRVVVGGFAVAGMCVLLPGRSFDHYFLLFTPSFGLLAACALARLSGAVKLLRQVGWSIVALGSIGLPSVQRMSQGNPYLGRWSEYRANPEGVPDPLIDEVKRWTTPGEPLALWGWETAVYVRSRCRQATRESNTATMSEPSAEREHFRQRYLSDLRKSRPRVFVDTTGAHRSGYTFEDFPELRAYLAENYRLHAEFGRRFIYLRRDLESSAIKP